VVKPAVNANETFGEVNNGYTGIIRVLHD